MKTVFTLFLMGFAFLTNAKETITIKTANDIEMTADLYLTSSLDNPFIILCHQAGWSRGEYLEIAPKLNALGYNCMAIDQRSGGEVNGIVNQTKKKAKAKGLGMGFPDAEVDILSAIKYVKQNYTKASKLMLWGSSYSSSLVLKIAGERNDIDGVLAFSPGEYFKRFGKPGDYIQSSAKHIKIPTFITSAKSEKKSWWSIYESIISENKTYFLPTTTGNHGSRALWKKFSDHEAYWSAVKEFLKTV
jgi:dienelactone hydrolase